MSNVTLVLTYLEAAALDVLAQKLINDAKAAALAVDAVVSTQLRVDELVSVLNVLLRSEP